MKILFQLRPAMALTRRFLQTSLKIGGIKYSALDFLNRFERTDDCSALLFLSIFINCGGRVVPGDCQWRDGIGNGGSQENVVCLQREKVF